MMLSKMKKNLCLKGKHSTREMKVEEEGYDKLLRNGKFTKHSHKIKSACIIFLLSSHSHVEICECHMHDSQERQIYSTNRREQHKNLHKIRKKLNLQCRCRYIFNGKRRIFA